MNTVNELLKNLDKIHTTELGVVRIKRNLSLNTDDVIEWCKTRISSTEAVITRSGKNWYIDIDYCTITVNAYSYTIITAHKQSHKQSGEQSANKKITLCGDNCIECPRYTAHTDEELKKAAKLWYRVGWTNTVISNEEIRCTGCSSHKQCTYHLVECIREHKINKCNQCNDFPCQKINDMLKRSEDYQKKCREVCSEQEYICLEKAFFNKENNLSIASECNKSSFVKRI